MPEAEIEVNGGIVVYEFVGPDDGEVVVLTPGGRSDIQLYGRSESHMRAETLGTMVKT
jgi:hypothetical protein